MGAGGAATVDENVSVLAAASDRPSRKPDHDAEFAAFMVADASALHRTARLLCGDAHRADELTQMALVRTYAAWPSARKQPLAYARRVLANARIDTWRARRREVLMSPEDMPEPQPIPTATDHRRGDDLEQALRKLP
jgi:DNA-directed RNA polymerase specialized sigma24 family protein